MGSTDQHIEGRRVGRNDCRQGIEDQLVALAGTEQAEAQDDVASCQPEIRLDRLRIDERQLRNAVGDDVQTLGIDAVDVAQERPS